jgi:predicted TIM-barrel fold metal-dependent hydrolase
LFRTIADLDWHVHLHVEAALIPELLAVLETAGPKLIIDHMGRPGPDDAVRGGWFRAIVGAVGRGRTWVKVSCAYRLGPSAEGHFHAFLEEADPERLFWASDCPFVGHEGEVRYEETIDWFARRIEDDETRRRVLGGNAHRFYFGLFRFLCG